MAKIDLVQTSFVGGELAPSLFGRTDIAQYSNACAIVENFLITPFGSLTSCPGTEFINDAKYDFVAGGNDDNTVLLLHFNGVDGTSGSTGFIDSAQYAITISSTALAQLDTSSLKFGSASGQFITADVHADTRTTITFSTVHIPDPTDVDSQTVDFWAKLNELSNGSYTQSFYEFGGTYTMFSTNGIIFFQTTNSGTFTMSSSTLITTASYVHIAFVKILTNMTIYINGINVASQSFLDTYLPSDIGYAVIGKQLQGRLDEFRISNIARWTSNFTPPDMEYGTEGTSEGISERLYGRSRLIPFVFARNDAYAIEAGEGYFRFYTDGAVVTA